MKIRINYLVPDETGKIVFNDYDGMWYMNNEDNIARALGFDADALISNAPPMQPATKDGKNVPVTVRLNMPHFLTIKGHNITPAKNSKTSWLDK